MTDELVLFTRPSYELCATFDTAVDADGTADSSFWSHPAGRRCFGLQTKGPVLE